MTDNTNKESPIKTVGHYLLLKLSEEKKEEKDSIIIPAGQWQDIDFEKKIEGIIVSRGKSCGIDITLDPNKEFPGIGEEVIFKKYCGINKKIGEDCYRLLKDEDIICIKKAGEDIPLIPIGPRILLKIEKIKEKSDGGIVIPNIAKEGMQNVVSEGVVVAYSNSCIVDYTRGESDLPPIGSNVFYIKYSGFNYEHGNDLFCIINDEDLYGAPTDSFKPPAIPPMFSEYLG